MFSKERLNFLDFDIYSRRISFYYKNKEKFGTTFGFILTILYIVLSLIIFLIYFIKTLKREDITASSSIIYPTEIPSIEINNDLFYIAFGLEQPDRSFIDERIYYQEVLYIKKIKEKGEFINESQKILNIERCNIKKFGKNYQHLIDNTKLNNSFCLKDANITLKGGLTFNEMSYIKINIYPCINNSNNNNHCLPQNIINDFFESANFSIFFKDIRFNPFNYSFPTKPILQNFNTALGKSIFKEYVLHFGLFEINTDIGFFSNEMKKETYLKYIKDFHSSLNIDNGKSPFGKEIFTTQILLEDCIYYQKRTFTKMSEVFSTTGGYMQVISTIFALLALFTKKFGLEQNLLNSLFNFNIKQRKIILSIEYKKKMDCSSPLWKGKRSFIPYEPQKTIISKKSRRENVIILNSLNDINNNVLQERRSITMQPNLNVIKTISNKSGLSKEEIKMINKASKKNKKENINRSKMIMMEKEDDLIFEDIMKQKKDKNKKTSYNILNDLIKLDNGGRSTINFNIFDYYCLRKINNKKKSEIEIFNFGINFFKNQLDIINFFNITILTQMMLTQQAEQKENFLSQNIELSME